MAAHFKPGLQPILLVQSAVFPGLSSLRPFQFDHLPMPSASPPAAATMASRALPRSLSHAPESCLAQVNDFELIALVGRGAFADVWKVRDRRTGQFQALKQLRADCTDQPAARQLLKNEAEIGRKIACEYVVKVGHARCEIEPPYLVMEWLSGRTLDDRLAADRRLFCSEALWIARQCAQGMHALMVAGYTHGDIKPSNIFLCDNGMVKLIDLGFARPDRLVQEELMTHGRAVTGTPEYLAPETLISSKLGGAARDVYSLGVTLYRMLSGSLPFEGETVIDLVRKHQQSLPPRLRSLTPDVPREVGEFVHRLLSKQPLRRGSGLSWLVQDLIGLELSLLSVG